MIQSTTVNTPQPWKCMLQVSKLIRFICFPLPSWHQVHLSLCPFPGKPKMECPGRWLAGSFYASPVSCCLVLGEKMVSVPKRNVSTVLRHAGAVTFSAANIHSRFKWPRS